jgi:26S proteasome regulatory subunit T2
MGNTNPTGPQRNKKGKDPKKEDEEKKITKKPDLMSMQLGRKRKKKKGVDIASKLPTITPNTKCLLRLRKFERIKDYLLMEKEYIQTKKVNVKRTKMLKKKKT